MPILIGHLPFYVPNQSFHGSVLSFLGGDTVVFSEDFRHGFGKHATSPPVRCIKHNPLSIGNELPGISGALPSYSTPLPSSETSSLPQKLVSLLSHGVWRHETGVK
jgi:hypothetical protein